MPQYDNFTNPMSAGNALNKLNGMMDSVVGHNHDPEQVGNGAKIPTTALSGPIATSVLSGTISGSAISGPVASAATATTALTATTATSLTMTSNVDAGNYQLRCKQGYFDVPTGFPPLVIDSTTEVTNLNADKIDSFDLLTIVSGITSAITSGNITTVDIENYDANAFYILRAYARNTSLDHTTQTTYLCDSSDSGVCKAFIQAIDTGLVPPSPMTKYQIRFENNCNSTVEFVYKVLQIAS